MFVRHDDIWIMRVLCSDKERLVHTMLKDVNGHSHTRLKAHDHCILRISYWLKRPRPFMFTSHQNRTCIILVSILSYKLSYNLYHSNILSLCPIKNTDHMKAHTPYCATILINWGVSVSFHAGCSPIRFQVLVVWRYSHVDKAQAANQPRYSGHLQNLKGCGQGPLSFHAPTKALSNIHVMVT